MLPQRNLYEKIFLPYFENEAHALIFSILVTASSIGYGIVVMIFTITHFPEIVKFSTLLSISLSCLASLIGAALYCITFYLLDRKSNVLEEKTNQPSFVQNQS